MPRPVVHFEETGRRHPQARDDLPVNDLAADLTRHATECNLAVIAERLGVVDGDDRVEAFLSTAQMLLAEGVLLATD